MHRKELTLFFPPLLEMNFHESRHTIVPVPPVTHRLEVMTYESFSNPYAQSVWTPHTEWDYYPWTHASVSTESNESQFCDLRGPTCSTPMVESWSLHQTHEHHPYEAIPATPSSGEHDLGNNFALKNSESSSCRFGLQKDDDGSKETTNVKRKAGPSMGRKERRRTISLNSAFSTLRSRIPKVPADTKLSKIKTLRLAALYIQYLNKILNEPEDGRQMQPNDFEVDLHQFKRNRPSTRSSIATTAPSSSPASSSSSASASCESADRIMVSNSED